VLSLTGPPEAALLPGYRLTSARPLESRPELNPIERLWRDLKDQLADIPTQTIAALSDAMCAIIQSYAPATLHSLTRFTYFVQAIETFQKVLYG
jgi:hypothetical protein